jgi:hypothetical protein
MFYLATLSVGHTNGTQRRMVGRLVKDELQMGTEMVMTYYEVLSGRMPGWAEDNHEKPKLILSVSGPRFDFGASRIRSRSTTHETMTSMLDN